MQPFLTFTPWTWYLQLPVYCNLSFIFIALLNSLSRPPCMDSNPETHRLALAAIRSGGERLCNSLTLESFISSKSVAHGWHCQSFCSSGGSRSPVNHSCTRFWVLTLEKHSLSKLLLKIGKLSQLDSQFTTSFIISLHVWLEVRAFSMWGHAFKIPLLVSQCSLSLLLIDENIGHICWGAMFGSDHMGLSWCSKGVNTGWYLIGVSRRTASDTSHQVCNTASSPLPTMTF